MISHAQRSSLAIFGFALALAAAAAVLLFASFGPLELLAPVPTNAPAERPADPAALLPIDAFLPQQKLDLAPDVARARNHALPFYRGFSPPAPPFDAAWLPPAELERETDCLAAAIYYEAATEPVAGQRAVAQVVLNRLRHPRFPKRICDVVYQGAERRTGCQFTFTCDGSLARAPVLRRWLIAKAIANAALHGAVSAPVGQSTHYHASYVFARWAPELRKIAMIGTHIFYAPHQAYGGFIFGAPRPAEPLPPVLPAIMGSLPVDTAAAAPPAKTDPPVEKQASAQVTAATAPMPLPTPTASPKPSPAPAFPLQRSTRRLPLPGQD